MERFTVNRIIWFVSWHFGFTCVMSISYFLIISVHYFIFFSSFPTIVNNLVLHSCPQRLHFLWSAPRIATSYLLHCRKSLIHGLPVKSEHAQKMSPTQRSQFLVLRIWPLGTSMSIWLVKKQNSCNGNVFFVCVLYWNTIISPRTQGETKMKR